MCNVQRRRVHIFNMQCAMHHFPDKKKTSPYMQCACTAPCAVSQNLTLYSSIGNVHYAICNDCFKHESFFRCKIILSKPPQISTHSPPNAL